MIARLMIVPLVFALAAAEEMGLPGKVGVVVPSGRREYRERLEFDLNRILLDLARFTVVSAADIREALPAAYPADCWGLNLKKFRILHDSLKIDYLVLACISRLETYWDSYRDTTGHHRDYVKAEATVYLRILNLADRKSALSTMVTGSTADTSVTSRQEALDNAYGDCLSDIRRHLKQFFVLRGMVTEIDQGLYTITIGEEMGAREKMKFKVLKDKRAVGFLEITTLDVGKSWTRPVAGRRRIRPGMPVQELPFGLTFCELTPAYLNGPVSASANAALRTGAISRFSSYGLGFGFGRVWHFQGGVNYGYDQSLSLLRLDLVPSYRLALIPDHLWGYVGAAVEPGLAFQPFHADTLLGGDSTGVTSKPFITAGPRAGFKIRFHCWGIDLAAGYLLKNGLGGWTYTKTINKRDHVDYPLKAEWLAHPSVAIGGSWEIAAGLSYNFEIY